MREHRADALVQVVERRLRQRRRESEQHPGDGAVDGRLHREAAAAAERRAATPQRTAITTIGDRHSALGRVLVAAGRVAEVGEQREPDDDHDRADHLAPTDVLLRQPVAERQGEDDRVTSSGWMIESRPRSSAAAWNTIAGEQGGRAEQPHRLAGEPPSDIGRASAISEGQRTLLLQRGGQREQERGDQRESMPRARALRRADGRLLRGYGRAVRYQFVDCRWSLDDPGLGRARVPRRPHPRARPSSTSSATSRRRRAPAGAIRCRRRPTSPRAAGAAGIGAGVFVVAYGSLGGAERLWWLLRHFGHDDCAVLDLDAWRGPLAAGEEPAEPARVRAARARRDDTIELRRARARGSRRARRRRRAARAALARRAEPDRPRPRPHPRRAQRALERAAAGAARRRARRLLRLGRHRLRHPPPAPPRRPRGPALPRLVVGVGAARDLPRERATRPAGTARPSSRPARRRSPRAATSARARSLRVRARRDAEEIALPDRRTASRREPSRRRRYAAQPQLREPARVATPSRLTAFSSFHDAATLSRRRRTSRTQTPQPTRRRLLRRRIGSSISVFAHEIRLGRLSRPQAKSPLRRVPSSTATRTLVSSGSRRISCRQPGATRSTGSPSS